MSVHPILTIGTSGGDLIHYRADGTIAQILQYPDNGDGALLPYPTSWNDVWPVWRLRYHSSGDAFIGQEDAGTVFMVNGQTLAGIKSAWIQDYAVWGGDSSSHTEFWWEDAAVYGDSLWVVASTSFGSFPSFHSGTEIRHYEIIPHQGVRLVATYNPDTAPPPVGAIDLTDLEAVASVGWGRSGIYNMTTFDGHTFYGMDESSLYRWSVGEPHWTFVRSLAHEMTWPGESAVPYPGYGGIGNPIWYSYGWQHVRSISPMAGIFANYFLLVCYGEQNDYRWYWPKILVVHAPTGRVAYTIEMWNAPVRRDRSSAWGSNIFPFGACYNPSTGYIYTGDTFRDGDIWRANPFTGNIELWGERPIVVDYPDPYPGSWAGLIVPESTRPDLITNDPFFNNNFLAYGGMAVPPAGFTVPASTKAPKDNQIWPYAVPVNPNLDLVASGKRLRWDGGN